MGIRAGTLLYTYEQQGPRILYLNGMDYGYISRSIAHYSGAESIIEWYLLRRICTFHFTGWQVSVETLLDYGV
jgi:hypothetical protein